MLKKRSLPLLLILLMVFSSVAQAATISAGSDSSASKITNALHKYSKSANTGDAGKNYKKTDKVRVIVEVDGAPAITYATQQGKQYSELSKSVKAQLQNKVLNEQQAVKSQFAKKSINMQFKQNFTTTFNGFSGEVEYGQIPAIKSVDGVANVTIAHEYQRPEAQPDLKYSKEIVQAQQAWDKYGFKGQGMVVAIIDTGIDYTHKDMVLSDPSQAALTQDKVNQIIADKGLPGKFYTDKVPYGYNYYDENDQIKDLGPNASMHGMHVSGIVAANGDETNGSGIKGVAPEAQLLAMKIFGNDPEMKSTWSDIEIKAIDDSIKLGADVVNMSLGSTGAFVLPNDPEQVAIQRATDNGVLMSISAGNSDNIGYGYANTFANNPDKGVVGAPGLANSSIQVASLENSYIDLYAATYSVDGTEAGKAPFLSASKVDPNQQTQKKFEVLAAGIGDTSDFQGKDFHGKYALVKRGTLNFVTKTLNAQAAGAAGIIVYNNTDGFVSMATESDITIPQLFMLKSDGDSLKAQLDAGKKVEVEFQGDKVKAVNPTADQISDFSSWGVTPNLDFKPEITAPGGNIYSTLNNNSYGVMSGTSMAAPHVSGGSALVLERVKKDFASLTGADKVQMAKNLLMNTSKVITDKGLYNKATQANNPYSPRRQGAGLMQLNAALSTPVVVTNTNTNEAKVALKEIDGDQATFTLKAQNFSDKDVTYKVNGNVQTDLAIKDKNGVYVDQGEAQGIYKADSSFDPNTGVGEFPISFSQDELTVPANGSATVDVTVDLSNNIDWWYNIPLDQIFKNGYFVEGFVTLTDVNDVNPTVSVPYVGFKGDWNKPPVLDDMIYDGKAVTSFYKKAGLLTHAGKDEKGIDQFNYLGYNPVDDSLNSSKIAISPNGDGVNDDVTAYLSFLRNAKTVDYKILDKDGNVLRKIKSDQLVLKNFNDGGRGIQAYLDPSNAWDGKVNNKVVKDGQYYYEIDTSIDYPGKDPQVLKVPVTVDTVAPKVTASVSGDKLTIKGSDNGSGIAYYDVLVNGTSVFGDKDAPLAGNATSYTFKETPKVGSTVDVVAYDFAGNKTDAVVDGVNDTTIPYIYVTSIGATNAYTTHELPVSGYVTDESKIREVTVNGNPVDLTWNADKKEYDFSTKVTFDSDGIYAVPISATDVAGNTISYKVRDLIVDATAPVINVDADVPTTVKSDMDSVDLKATISDNFDQLRYFVNGNEEFYKPSNGLFEMNSVSQDVTTHVSLEPGNNTFTLKLVDRAGNVTTKEVNIFRGDVPAAPTGVKAASAGYNKVTVSWTKVTGASGYDLYRSTSKTGTFTKVATVSTSSYTNSGLSTGKTYYYKVQAFATVDGTKVTGSVSAVVSAKPVLSAPTGLKASKASSTSIKTSWSSVSGATGYELYRATSKYGSYTKVKSISSSSYTNSGLAKGKTYYYKVRAYRSVGGKNAYSSYSSVVSLHL